MMVETAIASSTSMSSCENNGQASNGTIRTASGRNVK